MTFIEEDKRDVGCHLVSYQTLAIEGEFDDIHKEKDKRVKPSIDETPNLEFKELPKHLEYAFLQEGSKLPVIITLNLLNE